MYGPEWRIHYMLFVVLGSVSLMTFLSQFRFDGNFALLLFNYWPEDHN